MIKQVANTPQDLWVQVTAWLLQIMEESKNSGLDFHLAIPGGSTPQSLFEYWASNGGDGIAWNRIHFWWTDERVVAPDHALSNYRMTKNALFNSRAIDPVKIHRVQGELGARKAASLYGMEIEENLLRINKRIPLFNAALLGVGDDGHIASLFPDQVPVEVHPWAVLGVNQGVDRVSLPYDILSAAHHVAFLVTGPKKQDILQKIHYPQNSKDLELPASILQRLRPDSIWFMDTAATQKLDIKESI